VSAGILRAGGKIRNEALVAEGLPSLNKAMRAAKIDNPRRIAAFITTLGVESMFEYNISQIGATSTYRGRGYIQLTGSANYAEASLDLGVDLSNNPELARSLEWSARIATWYWTEARPSTNAYADALRMGMVNKQIGFPVSPADDVRCQMFAQALKVLTGSIPEGITCTR
jgi:putative chitinase